MKEFHLWCNNLYKLEHKHLTLHTVIEVTKSILRDKEVIYTTQVCTVSTRLFDFGYRIFVHDLKGETFEITLGKCDRTDKEILMTQNLAKMLENGAFGDVLLIGGEMNAEF